MLLVIIDDVGNGPIPNFEPNGANQIKATMPHLETLMSNGLSLDNVWVSPSCSPTRAGILTGMHGHKTGVLDPGTSSNISEDAYTIFDAIKEQSEIDYASAVIGKWHLGNAGGGMNANLDAPYAFGMDYFAGLLGGGVTDYYSWRVIEDGSNNMTTDYATTKFTDLAIDWINDQEQPWFCWLAYTGAHSPYHLPPVEMHTQGALPTDSASIAENTMPYFIAMVESVDFELGRIEDSLAPEVWANTVVIFLGDNGTPGNVINAPYSSNRAKGSVYQGGINVPMVVAGPGIERINERDTALVNGTDLFSTLLAICGGPEASYEDSNSMLPLFEAAGNSIRDCAYIDAGPPNNPANGGIGYAVRDNQFKLLMNQNNGNTGFYDLLADPYEQSNLINADLDQVQSDALSALQSKIAELSLSAAPFPTAFYIEHYPNPVQDILTVETNLEQSRSYDIFDLQGKLLLSSDLQEGHNKIDLSSLSPGLYVFLIDGYQSKIVKR